jgi:predicted ATPase
LIQRIIIEGYRRFERLDISPVPGMNIIVGDNESGKSTLLEAIGLALTGRVNGRPISEELNPYWFHQPHTDAYFAGQREAAPEILIELHLRDDDAVQALRGVHNSGTTDCPGVRVRIAPSVDYAAEFAEYVASGPPPVVPVEYYDVDWRDFSDRVLVQRPKQLATAHIDARTIRSTSGVDYHTREMLAEHLDSRERTALSVAHRRARQEITETVLAPINERIAGENATIHDRPIGLQMDQSGRTSWEAGVVPQVDRIPFAMAGQGQQASLKVALAMSRTAGTSTYVLVEEPENHLSYTTLARLLGRLQGLASEEQQLFVTTHSSFVVNRLGLDRLLLLHDGVTATLGQLGEDTVVYFRKLAGYDTLRLVLAEKLILVEGPSDGLIVERAIRDATNGTAPLDLGIDIVSMDGLTFKRALEVCTCLARQAVALQDNDGNAPEEVINDVRHLLDEPRRTLVVSDPAKGATLEPQLISANDDDTLRRVLGLTPRATPATWMRNNKAEAALRILDADESINYPDYIREAVASVL